MVNPSMSDKRRNVSRRETVRSLSSTGEPLAGFPRYESNIVPPPGRIVLHCGNHHFPGIPLRARTPAANDSLLLTMYAVENPGETRTITLLATS